MGIKRFLLNEKDQLKGQMNIYDYLIDSELNDGDEKIFLDGSDKNVKGLDDKQYSRGESCENRSEKNE